jgi:pimeloyl-ACP methyl ester carboxylesterase
VTTIAPQRIEIDGVALHYMTQGSGDPLIFVHGGGNNLWYWRRHLEPFAERWRVVAYSRRYAEPNDNPALDPSYAAPTDARDLAALLDALEIERAHVVAHSIGAVAALFLATRQPERFRTLVVAEPPVLRWARDLPGGEALWQDFMRRMWLPAGERFEAGDAAGAMRAITDYFVGEGTFDRLSERSRTRVLKGARDWEAFQRSRIPFPDLPREAIRALRSPVLMLSAARTTAIHHLVDDELARLLPDVERVRVADATHDMWLDQPEVCRRAAMGFLERRGSRGIEAGGDDPSLRSG